ncbi:patched family domain-containing protein [Ditylenchus destructor]|uniref:Patched family domain-containing protein n=1 Tax=Ditylenchus destructor TaxID=166010 RepID=A0AAD4N8N6_9BILA|nr:patched family domain-containing protein [Ditylenchus destructor]
MNHNQGIGRQSAGNITLPMAENNDVAERLRLFSPTVDNGEMPSKETDDEPQNTGQNRAPTMGSNRGPKQMKFFVFMRHISLRNLFRILGCLIGTYPWCFLLVAFLMASLSLGMLKLKLRDRVRDGYTPATSQARYETDVLKEFLGSQGDPLLTIVLLRALDGGSMHRPKHLNEAVELHSYLRKNITASFRREEADESEPSEMVRYEDICGRFCDANVAVDYFYKTLVSEITRHKSGKKAYAGTKLIYPIAKLSGYDLHLERNFYGVRQRNTTDPLLESKVNETIIDKDDDVEALRAVTPIEHIEAVIMTFRGEISHPDDEAKMSAWEMKVYEFSNHLNSSLLEVLVLGSEIVDYEMNKDAQKTAPYFVMGFCFMFSFTFYTLLAGSFFYAVLDWAKLALALGISLCPTLAITSTFGICSLVGLRTNSVMLLMPFLICGIGVNDAFLITHAWHRTAGQTANSAQFIPRRLGLVLEDVGPSITITTLTNVITFGIGALTPTPEISLFCLATAIALGFAYLYTLVLFVPFIYFATIVENDAHKSNQSFFGTLCQSARYKLYCNTLTHPLCLIVLAIGTLVYWYFAIMGTLNINAKLDTEKILPKDCPILEPHRLISHMVWTEYYPVTVLVNNPLDIRSKYQLDRFNSMLDEFESLKLCKGKQYTQIWLRDYIQYWNMVKEFGFDYFDTQKDTANTPASETGIDFSKLSQFLSSPFHKHHGVFLRLNNDTSPDAVPISKFWFVVTFHNTTSWDERIDLMVEWRRVADNYQDLNVTVWEVNGMFVDQMLSLKSLTLQTTVLTLACMTVVCAIFIQNPVSVAVAVAAIGSISIGVIGYLSWWHLNLDPVTLCAVLMSIGMSVDFTAHVTYHFQLTYKREMQIGTIVEVPLRSGKDKMYHTIQAIAWPMSQAGLSTVICVIPLIFLQNYIPLVFVKTVTLVVIWGLFHGLVLLPAILAALPSELLELNCYRKLFERVNPSNKRSDQEFETTKMDGGLLKCLPTHQCKDNLSQPSPSEDTKIDEMTINRT